MLKANTKSFIIILVTLLLGIAIGFEINEILLKKKFEKFRDIRKPKGFIGMFEEIIQPDNEQKPKIESILMNFHKKTESIMSGARSEMNLELDSLRMELVPILNKEQLKRFDDEAGRMKKGIPPGKDRPYRRGEEPPGLPPGEFSPPEPR